MNIAAIGECLIELAPIKERNYQLGFAGDTFNTAYYLRQIHTAAVSYVTAVGDDNYSQQLINFIGDQQIDLSFINQINNSQSGLYLISNEVSGERAFTYYREHAAAKKLIAQLTEEQQQQLTEMDILYFSGITLAILDEPQRKQFFSLLEKAKGRGALIVCDNNYREKLWSNKNQALKTMQAFHQLTDLLFVTADDEKELYDDNSVHDTILRYFDCTLPHVVIKDGANPVQVLQNKRHYTLPVPLVNQVVDTTAAGDSFNAGYLSAVIDGLGSQAAVKRGHQLASTVIQSKGAIVPVKQLVDLPA